MLNQNSIFISYRRSDSIDVTGRIHDRLESRYGKNKVFKDVDSIPFGVDIGEHIYYCMNRCQVLIAVIGPTWLKVENNEGHCRLDNPKDWVRLEIETALKRDILVIPLLVSNARLPEAVELPTSLQNLAELNSAYARPDPDFHSDMNRLIQRLDESLNISSQHLSNESIANGRRMKTQKKEYSRLFSLKTSQLKKRISILCEDYEALTDQLSYAGNAVEKASIKRQQKALEKEILELENELNSL